MTVRFASLALGAVLLFAAPVSAETFKSGNIEIKDPWARASAGMAKAGAAYMSVVNHGGADRIVGAKAAVSEKAELHTHIQEGDVMRMREVPAIEVPMHGQVEMKPGGLHIMFINLAKPLEEGASFPLTLMFEKGGAVEVKVKVAKPGAGMAPGGMMPQHMENMKSDHMKQMQQMHQQMHPPGGEKK